MTTKADCEADVAEMAPTGAAPAGRNVPPLTDSAWFWTYLFATAGLVALFLAGPRYIERQPQIERQFAARQSSGQVVMGRDGPIPHSTSERMIVSLRPLYAVCAAALTSAWIVLWYQRFRQESQCGCSNNR
jgi:hypothetical protein